jgi:hypothetical protein
MGYSFLYKKLLHLFIIGSKSYKIMFFYVIPQKTGPGLATGANEGSGFL